MPGAVDCKDCRRVNSLRVDDVWKLYNPSLPKGPNALVSGDGFCKKKYSKGLTCGKTYGKVHISANS
jgi:hypothetical protein